MGELKRKHRVLFISEEYPPIKGGVGTSTRRVAHSLKALGCDVIVVTFDCSRPLSDGDYIVSEIDDKVDVMRVGPFFHRHPDLAGARLSDAAKATMRRRAFDTIQELAQNFKPSVVLSFYAVNAGLIGTYVAGALGVPHIAGIRGNDIGRNMFSESGRCLLEAILSGSDHIACLNHYLHSRLKIAFRNLNVPSSVVFNAVEVPPDLVGRRARSYLREVAGWPDSDPVCVFIGTLREKKGTAVLVHAMREVLKSASVRLLIVGSTIDSVDRGRVGSVWDELVAMNAIHVTGFLDREQALRIAAEGDILVMPSLEDGLANGLLEGMTLGLCPIVSDVFADVIEDGRTGRVIRRGDVAALVAGILEIADDNQLRSALALSASRHVKENHHPTQEATAYIRLFEEVTR